MEVMVKNQSIAVLSLPDILTLNMTRFECVNKILVEVSPPCLLTQNQLK